MAIQYRFDLYRFNKKISELIDVDSINYSYGLRNSNPGRMTINANGLSTFDFHALQFGSQIRVFRKGFSDTAFRLVYEGEIRNVSKVNDSVKKKEIKFDLYPAREILKQRFITKTFTSEEEADIIWGIINETQTNTLSGNFTASQASLDIKKGAFDTSNNIRTRTYDNDNVRDALENIVKVKDTSGNPQRLRNYRISPDFIENSYRVASYEADFGITRKVTYLSPSIRNFSLTENFEYANHVIAVGKNGLVQQAFSVNEGQKNNYRLKTKVVTDNSLTTAPEVLELAEETLALSERFPVFFEFQIPDSDELTGLYRVGDSVRVKYKDEFFDVDASLKVLNIDVGYREDNESVKLKVAEQEPATLNTTKVEKLSEYISNGRKEIYNLSK